MRTRLWLINVLWLFVPLLAGCASSSPVKEVRGYTPAIGEKAARTAMSMIGKPYKYRATAPRASIAAGWCATAI